MKARDFTALVTGGRIPKGVSLAIAELIRQCDGKTLIIRISEKVRRRSLKQNSFYFGFTVPFVVQMFRDSGDLIDEDAAHDYLMKEVGKYVYRSKLTGNAVRRSSTSLSVVDWEEYQTAIRAWAASFGYSAPFPNEFNAATPN